MDDQDTSGDQDDTGATNDWMNRYQGLQRVVSKRDADLAALQAERDRLVAEAQAREGDDLELQQMREAREAKAAEDAERQAYEALRTKFEEPEVDPGTPGRQSLALDVGWGGKYGEPRERKAPEDVSTHWPS